ncbi:MAG: cadherin domain-containing protein [Bradymonadia bacterium]
MAARHRKSELLAVLLGAALSLPACDDTGTSGDGVDAAPGADARTDMVDPDMEVTPEPDAEVEADADADADAEAEADMGMDGDMFVEADAEAEPDMGMDDDMFVEADAELQADMGCADTDGDGVCDDEDICAEGDDSADADGDGVPDACDVCPGGDDGADADGDGVPDGCDLCEAGEDGVDTDGDGVPDACDNCVDAPNPGQLDSDGDWSPLAAGVDFNLRPSPANDLVLADGESTRVELGFEWSYFGLPVTEVVVSARGFIYVNPQGAAPMAEDAMALGEVPEGGEGPIRSTTPGVIAGFWTALAPSSGGRIAYETVGEEGSRELRVAFEAVPYGPGEGPTVSFQMILRESGGVEIQCESCLPLEGTPVVQGAQSWRDATFATAEGRNGVAFDAVEDAIEFTWTSVPGTGDGAGDACDVCPLDITDDTDADTVCDTFDLCPGEDDTLDADADDQPDACDPCPQDNPDDTDGDGVCDSADVCAGGDDNIDGDGDGVADFCDPCPQDNPNDTDGDGVCDAVDACPGGDDAVDGDGDGVANFCDVCPLDNPDDPDGDTVCTAQDICAGGDDRIDGDGDGTPDFCDVCPADNPNDTDGDTVCDSADACPGGDDRVDGDGDGVADFCDVCPADNPDDSDGDTVCDSVDACPGGDDRIDNDGDGTPDFCDVCPADNPDDSDFDSICDSADVCPGGDDRLDGDGDGVADFCDVCPLDNPNDSDGDTVCDTDDVCPNEDDRVDTDGDNVPDACDRCPLDAPDDPDGDGLCTTEETNNLGTNPDLFDTDEDGLDDGTELGLGTDPLDPDSDGDGVLDGIEILRFGSDPNDPIIRSRQPNFQLTASAGRGLAGLAVGVTSDINDDGYDEILVGAPSFDGPAGPDAGRFYVVYGSSNNVDIDLDAIEANNQGFIRDGADGNYNFLNTLCVNANPVNYDCFKIEPNTDLYAVEGWRAGLDGGGLGTRTESIGDFDGDGVGDFAVSSPWARVDQGIWGGEVHIISGATAAEVDLNALEGDTPVGGSHVAARQGTVFIGEVFGNALERTNGDVMGFEITGDFDINGDGLSDLAIFSANQRDVDPSDVITVIFGRRGGFSSSITDYVNSDAGFQIAIVGGAGADGFSPNLEAPGDVNGDGFGDLIINTPNNSNGFFDGDWSTDQNLFLLFGGATHTDLILGELSPDRGIRLDQGRADILPQFLNGFLKPDILRGNVPMTVSQPLGSGGDVNGDGLADVVMTGVMPSASNAHGAWVAFGQSNGQLTPVSELHNNQGQGFAITELARTEFFEWERLGESVTIVQDMNGDGLDEIAVAWEAASTPQLANNGRVYVIWGKRDTDPVDLRDIEAGIGGFIVEGAHAGAGLGESLDGSGDIDGDGLGDLVIGVPDTFNANGLGGVAVVLGEDFTESIFELGGELDDTFDGLPTGETLVGGRGNDTLRGNGGPDVLYGGQGNDRFEVADATFQRIRGGSGFDTLAMVGPSWRLLPSTFRGRLFEVEAIDLSAPEPHSVALARQDVLEMQKIGNTVFILGTAEDDVVLTGGDWTLGMEDEQGFVMWYSGLATVRVQNTVTVRPGAAFAQDPFRFNLPELTADGGIVGDVSVLDGTFVTYGMLEDPLNAFGVNANGELFVADTVPLDFETVPEVIQLRVSAETENGVVTSTRVFVQLTDENEPPVWAAALDSMTLPESAQDGTVVGGINPTPVDPDAEDTFTYSIVAGNDDGIFAIDPNTGAIRVVDNRALDFETQPQHTLTLRATDAQGAFANSPPQVIDLTNVNIVEAPFDLTFSTVRQSMWADANPLPNFNILNPSWTSNPQAGEIGAGEWTARFSGFYMTIRTQGRMLANFVMQSFFGEYSVEFPINTRVTYPDAITTGTAFDFDTTLTWNDGRAFLGSPSWRYEAGMQFINFGIQGMQFCAATACHDPGRNFQFSGGFNEARIRPTLYREFPLPSTANGFDHSFDWNHAPVDFRIAWVNYLNVALRALGVPTNVGEFDFFPFGPHVGGYRVNYVIVEPEVVLAHGVNQRFRFQVSTVPYTITLEDGVTTIDGQLGTTTPITLPAGADTNNDGRVDFTLTITPEATWTTRSTHNTTYALEITGMRVSVAQLDSIRREVGRYPETTGYFSRIINDGPDEIFEETRPVGGLNSHTLRGSFDLTPPAP